MNYYFNKLKQNKIFKIVLILIIVFFSILIYFGESKAVNCQCSDWECTYSCDDAYGGCSNTCWCADTTYNCPPSPTPTGAPPCPLDQTCVSCPPGSYVCNRGCCPYTSPTPTPPTDGGICDPNSWTTCSVTCGGGSKANNCGNVVACNEQECCTPTCGGTECGDLAQAPNKVTGINIVDPDPGTNTTKASGNINLTSTTNLAISWAEPTVPTPGTITGYYVQIWDKNRDDIYGGPSPFGDCDTVDSKCKLYEVATKTEALTIAASYYHDNDVYVAVRAVNKTCLPINLSVGWGDWSDNSSYNLVANVSGNFYNDQDPTYVGFSNRCTTDANSVLTDLSSYSGTTLNIGETLTTESLTTAFSFTDVPYAPDSNWERSYGFDISLSIGEPSDLSDSIICSCPEGDDPFLCELTTNASPSTGNNIFLVDINLSNGPWWQTMGGLVYSKEIFATTIPDTCELSALCDAYIITQNSSGDSSSAGIPLTGVSQISQGDGGYSERDFDPRAVNTDHDNLIKENYAYFNRGVDLLSADTISGTITSLPTEMPEDELTEDAEVYHSNGDLTIELTSPQNIASNKKVVIFVDGNLTFSSTPDTQMIDVSQGGFIAFIASGNITFDALVGNTDETSIAPNIAGVFIADGTINVNGYSDTEPYDDDSKDNKFVGEGTFVGWTGFNLNRDYENDSNPLQKELNNLNPTEVFIFRPDFNKNIPAIMMQPSLVWQEVN